MGKATSKAASATQAGLHSQLKTIVDKELSQLPDLLSQLEPKERVRAILQLLPYVTPKIEVAPLGYNDGFDW